MTEDDAHEIRGALSAALYRVFRALARVCLRRGLPFDAVSDIAKRAFVDVATNEFGIPGRKQSASRVALLTGIHRKEIGRMWSTTRPDDVAATGRVASAAGVITGWRRDRRASGKRALPASLPFDGATPSFSDLVRRHGRGDLPARAVLDELLRVGAVRRLRDGRIKLEATAYVPAATSVESLAILGTDVADLVAAIDHNLSSPPESSFLQRKVAYDNVPDRAVSDLLARAERDGRSLLERLDRVLARKDRDANPSVRGSGRKRIMVGVYSFAEDVEEEEG